jgi:uncharacterized protein YbgA (DUF1722 family)/uncharacterized protein YbbK (DUF523 family)
MPGFPKPTVVMSLCLELEPVRYNAQVIPFQFMRELEPSVEYIPICPEVEIGLGVPRDPIRIVDLGEGPRLVQPSSETDVSKAMRRFSERFFGALPEVDGFILKSRSPSCGIKDVKVYSGLEKSGPVGKSAGFFGGAVLERYPGLAVEDEGRLTNFRIREHFLTRIFTNARFREVKGEGSIRALVRFHSENKHLLLAYDQQAMRKLGRIAANPDQEPVSNVVSAYEATLARATAKMPNLGANINVLQHAFGYVSDQLSQAERELFLETLARYRSRRIPLSAVTQLLRAWIVRFEVDYLADQTYFQPFPDELVSMSDSGKGREVR